MLASALSTSARSTFETMSNEGIGASALPFCCRADDNTEGGLGTHYLHLPAGLAARRQSEALARDALDAHRVEVRLGGSTGRIQAQVALLKELHLPELGASFIELPARRREPRLEVCRRCGEIVAPLDRRLGEGRIGVMVDVGYAGRFRLHRDRGVEVKSHMVEVADHGLDLGNLPALLLDL